MKRIIFFIALLIHATVFSQGKIKGLVVEKDSIEPIPFANVVLKIGDKIIQGTTTNFKGEYELQDVEDGIYTLEVSYIGYETERFLNQEVKKSSDVTVTAWLGRGVILKEVEITAYEEPLIKGAGCYFSCSMRDEIEVFRCIGNVEPKVKEEADEEIGEIVIRKLAAYPNPSNGEGVTLNYSTSNRSVEREVQLELFDLLGKQIYFNELMVLNGELKLSLDVLATVKPGNYIIRLKDQQNVLSQRLVVSR